MRRNGRMGTPSRDAATARPRFDATVKAGTDAITFHDYHTETVYAPHAAHLRVPLPEPIQAWVRTRTAHIRGVSHER